MFRILVRHGWLSQHLLNCRCWTFKRLLQRLKFITASSLSSCARSTFNRCLEAERRDGLCVYILTNRHGCGVVCLRRPLNDGRRPYYNINSFKNADSWYLSLLNAWQNQKSPHRRSHWPLNYLFTVYNLSLIFNRQNEPLFLISLSLSTETKHFSSCGLELWLVTLTYKPGL